MARKKNYKKATEWRKPFRDWTKSDIYYGITYYRQKNGLPKLVKANILPAFMANSMRDEFLTLVGTENGKDLYALNTKVAAELTDESLELMFAKHKLKNSLPKRKPRYLMEYVATWPDRYEIVQEEVDIDKQGAACKFYSSIDGHYHHTQERGARIIEVIYNE